MSEPLSLGPPDGCKNLVVLEASDSGAILRPTPSSSKRRGPVEGVLYGAWMLLSLSLSLWLSLFVLKCLEFGAFLLAAGDLEELHGASASHEDL